MKGRDDEKAKPQEVCRGIQNVFRCFFCHLQCVSLPLVLCGGQSHEGKVFAKTLFQPLTISNQSLRLFHRNVFKEETRSHDRVSSLYKNIITS
jgi:hypothetical protein